MSYHHAPARLRLAHSALPADRPPAPGTVGEYLEDWLWGKQRLRPSTHAAYESHVRRYLIPLLGSVALADLAPVHIERMYRYLLAGGPDGRTLSVSTLHRLHATIMSALNIAVRRGLIDRNPAATVELPSRSRSSQEAWEIHEFREFLHVTEGHRLHLLFVLLGVVGLRRGEVVALRWRDVDLNVPSLRIQRSAVRVGGQTILGEPKSSTGIRTVALDDETARRLTWHAARQRLEVLQATGDKIQPALVFTTLDGSALDPAYVSREFHRIISRHGLRRIRLHDLRHTSASLGLATGESLLQVSRRLGHSSITVTADIYSHISPAVAKESATRLASAVYSDGPR